MEKTEILKKLYKGMIVSCQALKDEPLYGSKIMAKMALAAKIGGAAGIRANYAKDIKAIKREVDLPVIGLIKKTYGNSSVYITPTIKEVKSVVNAGADIVAVDATSRVRPDGRTVFEFIKEIKKRFKALVLADISTYEEAIASIEAGADMVSTTLSGYTDYSPDIEDPDFDLIENLSSKLNIPLIAEGRISTPEQARKAIELGAFAVVVGSAITRPQLIARRFSDAMQGVETKEGLSLEASNLF